MKSQKIRKLLLLLSFLFFPVTLFYFSPYLIIQGGFSGIISGSFLIFASLFVFSLFFGRGFCGWLCPAGGLQELCMQVQDKKIKSKKINLIKYFVWFFWILGIIFSFYYAGGIHSIDFFYMTEYGVSAASLPGMITYYGILLLITLLAFTLGRRGMCHSFCWMAPFMVLGTYLSTLLKLPSLHLNAKKEQCIHCGQCTKNCPMSLDVEKLVQEKTMANSECILCGTCESVCPKKVILLTFKK